MLNKMNKQFKFQEFWIRTKKREEEKGSIARSFDFNRPPSFSPPIVLCIVSSSGRQKSFFPQRLKARLGVIKGRKAAAREGQHS